MWKSLVASSAEEYEEFSQGVCFVESQGFKLNHNGIIYLIPLRL